MALSRAAPPAHETPAVAASPILAGGARLVHVTTVPASLWFLRGQAAFLRRRGVSVHAISSPGPELERFGAHEGVPIHPVAMSRSITPVRDVEAVLRMWRLLREIRPTIVDAHTTKAGLVAMIAAALAGIPVRIYHLHTLRALTMSGWKRRLVNAAERASCALAHRVIAVSPSVYSVAVEQGLCPRDRIRVLLNGTVNGVDCTTRFHPQPPLVRSTVRARCGIPADALVIGFVGRLARDKGIVELAAAWRDLRRARGAYLLLVGPEDDSDPVQGEVLAELRADDRVRTTGRVTDPVPLYAAMDVLVLPTYREGFPQVALEGGAMALPIVATAVCGCVDAVQDGVTGTLVPAHDARALAAALRRYLDEPALRTAHGAAARRRVVADFDREAVCAALAAEYRDLLQWRGPPGSSATRRGIPSVENVFRS